MGTLDSARRNIARIIHDKGPAIAPGHIAAALASTQRKHLADVLEELTVSGRVVVSAGPRGASLYSWVGEEPVGPAGTFDGWTGDSDSYPAVHHRLRRLRGPARNHSCADCGEGADQWSYDHADPGEMFGPTKSGRLDHRPYSTSVEHYIPRCYSCHTKADHERSRRIGAGESKRLSGGRAAR